MGTDATAETKKRPKRRLPKAKEVRRSPVARPGRVDRGDPPPEAGPLAAFMKERTLTVKEVVNHLGKSQDTIRLWLRQGRLKGWQLGGKFSHILVSEASVEEVLIRGATRSVW
jgi:excisionase family DNA binding protein